MKIAFLSFGHWADVPGSEVRTAADAYAQAIELAVIAEQCGIDGAYVRVHHFAPQFSSPLPLLAAIGARTERIELGTGVIDMRYENPAALAEAAAVTDLVTEGRLQLGISRGSPESVERGYETWGYVPREGETDGDMARRHTREFLAALRGEGRAPAAGSTPERPVLRPLRPTSETLPRRVWWGAGARDTAVWTARQGLNLMGSTLLTEDTGERFDVAQAAQIRLFREEWERHDHGFSPRVAVTRTVIPIVDERGEDHFGLRAQASTEDQVGIIGGRAARMGRSYIGQPEALAADLLEDAAVAAADTLLVTIPNQLGLDFNATLLRAIAEDVRPALDR